MTLADAGANLDRESKAPPWQPYREPLGTTLLRTGAIAVVGGAILSVSRGDLARWPAATLLCLWPAFGGHWVEVGFLNRIRPRLPSARPVQAAARIAVWLLGGAALALGMWLTAAALPGPRSDLARWPAWKVAALGGPAFVAVELLAHLGLALRRRPNFYDGRG